MSDDRASLGIRIAEAMGWEIDAFDVSRYRSPRGHFYTPIGVVSWVGYGEVDKWMREQGWKKQVIWLSNECVLVDYWAGWGPPGQHMDCDADEPLAAISAALKALEKQDEIQ